VPDDDSAFAHVLRLVAEGRLTAEEAGPILDALEAGAAATSRASAGRTAGSAGGQADASARAMRVQVTEAGRTIINLRVPLSLGLAAVTQVPGISEATQERIREAIQAGITGPIVEVDEDGDGVRISIE
jgi:hypothetical protein